MPSQSNDRTLFHAACLSAGLATAWGATATPAQAAIYQVEGWVEPTQALSRVYIGSYFWLGSPSWSSWRLLSAGPIAAGEKLNFRFFEEQAYGQMNGGGYAILALYDPANAGVTVGLSEDDAQSAYGKTWAQHFSKTWDFPTEAETAAALAAPVAGPPMGYFLGALWSHAHNETFHDHAGAVFGAPLTLVNFSTATAAGQAYASFSAVPEPATLSVAALVLMIFPRRRPR